MEAYHDKINGLIKTEITKADKRLYGGNFLAALSNYNFLSCKLTKPSRGMEYAIRSDCSLMAGLGVYARYLKLPDAHSILADGKSPTICSVCKHRFEHKNPDYETMSSAQRHRMQYGFHSQIDALDNYHILKHHNTIKSIAPSQQDIIWFREILSVLSLTSDENTIKDALKNIKDTQAFQMRLTSMKILAKENALATSRLTANTELFFERFLEILGFCSILDAGNYHGYYSGEVIAFPPRASWISDWYYPVDFWKGKHRINEDALSDWFGDFLK